MSTLSRKAALGADAALVTLAAVTSAADAHSKKKHFFLIGDAHGFGFYKHKWLTTGKLVWKWHDNECKGWW